MRDISWQLVDVCVNVEALVRLSSSPLRSAALGLWFQLVFVVSSLIFGEDESDGCR